MFCASRNVIGRLAWADADIAMTVDAPTTANACQRERRELRTVGVEEGEKSLGRERARAGNVAGERIRVETLMPSTVTPP
jgi:hypothetical protein